MKFWKKTITLFFLSFYWSHSHSKVRIAIISLYDDGYKKIGRYSDLNKQQYAKKHGYDIVLYHKKIDESRHGAWNKILAVEKHLNDYDWVFWSDADSLIMNKKIKLESIIDNNYDFIISKEDTKPKILKVGEMSINCKRVNTGSFLVKNTEWSKQFLKLIYNNPRWKEFKYWEQDSLEHLMATEPSLISKIKIVPQQIMNSVLYKHMHTYRPGEFIIHFMGLKMDQKERLMREWYMKTTK